MILGRFNLSNKLFGGGLAPEGNIISKLNTITTFLSFASLKAFAMLCSPLPDPHR